MSSETSGSRRWWARALAIVLGDWLFISAFVWPHDAVAAANTWIVGVLIVVVSVWSLFVPAARFANVLLALWLFFSTTALTHASTATIWNNVAVAMAVLLVSLIPGGPVVRLRAPEPVYRA